MASIICKRIDFKKGSTNPTRAKRLVEYISTPERAVYDEKGHASIVEKCTYFEAINFIDDSISSPADAWKQMATLCRSIDPESKKLYIEHWIISFSDKTPYHNDIISAAKDLLIELGYGQDHQAVIGIHEDTDNIHCHICVNRISQITEIPHIRGYGLNNRREKDTRDYHQAQKFLARASKAYGWTLENGCLFLPTDETETLQIKHPITGKTLIITRPSVEWARKKGNRANLPHLAKRAEMLTGIRSNVGQIQDIVIEAFNMKKAPTWGDFHYALAERGIVCELREHDGKTGITFSQDNVNWISGSKIGSAYTLPSLEKELHRRFKSSPKAARLQFDHFRRKANGETRLPSIIDEVRGTIPLTDQQITALLHIPLNDVRGRLGLPDRKPSRRVLTGLDAVMREMKPKPNISRALIILANAFPEIIDEKSSQITKEIQEQSNKHHPIQDETRLSDIRKRIPPKENTFEKLRMQKAKERIKQRQAGVNRSAIMPK